MERFERPEQQYNGRDSNMKVLALLEQLQKEACVINGVDPFTIQKNEFEFMINLIMNKDFPDDIKAMLVDETKATLFSLPTKYQNISSYQIMTKVVNDIKRVINETVIGKPENDTPSPKVSASDYIKHLLKSAASKQYRRSYKFDNERTKIIQNANNPKNITWKPMPLYGTIEYDTSFSAYLVRNKKPLIVVSGNVFIFASVLSSILAHCYPCSLHENESFKISTERKDWIALLNDEKQGGYITSKFCDLMLSLILDGTPSPAGIYGYESIQNMISTHITYTMELFVVAHEYSHFLFNHAPYKLSSLHQIFEAKDGLPLAGLAWVH
jgi:hypothetical protein